MKNLSVVTTKCPEMMCIAFQEQNELNSGSEVAIFEIRTQKVQKTK